MKKDTRLFSISDDKLRQHGETVAMSIGNDIGEFTAFDSTFDPAYDAVILNVINDLNAMKSDQVVIDEMTEYTQNSNDALAACNTAFRTISFFVRKTFPDNAAVQNQFGLNDIKNARKDQSKMVRFMDDLIIVCGKYGDTLIKGGCNPALIDSLPELREALNKAETAQEKFKKDRGLMTQERVLKLNELYRLLIPVSEIAQIIYADNEAKLSRYTLPRPKSSSNSDDDLIVA
jgi:hypothetical protein